MSACAPCRTSSHSDNSLEVAAEADAAAKGVEADVAVVHAGVGNVAVAAFKVHRPTVVEEVADADRGTGLDLPSLPGEPLGAILVDVVVNGAPADLDIGHPFGVRLDEIVAEDHGAATDVVAGTVSSIS